MKFMKQHIRFSLLGTFLGSCLLFLLTACGSGTLSDAVATANAKCPYALGKTGQLLSVTETADAVVFSYLVDEQIFPLENLKTQGEAAKAQLASLFSDPDNDTRELLALIAAEGKSLKYDFKGKNQQASHALSFTPEETSKMISKKKDAAKKAEAPLQEETCDEAVVAEKIAEANRHFPQALGNGIRIDSIEAEGRFLVYHCGLAETSLDIATIEKHADDVKKSIIKAQGKLGTFATLCKSMRKGLIVRYRGDKSQRTFGIIIAPDEMK